MQALQTMTSPNPSADFETVDAICPKHGAYKARVIDMSEIGGKKLTMGCGICSQLARDAEDARKVEEAERARRWRVSQLNDEAGIPTRFRSRSLDNYRHDQPGQKRALNVARRFVESWPEQRERGTSLIFTGSPGTGKTHLACAIGSALMEGHLASVAFGTVLELLRSIKDTYRKDSARTETEALRELLSYDLLIVDEIGAQLGTEHEKILLFELLNGRYSDCRPTILLSNLNAADLEGYLGQRVMDRYRECGAVIAFDWASHRGVK